MLESATVPDSPYCAVPAGLDEPLALRLLRETGDVAAGAGRGAAGVWASGVLSLLNSCSITRNLPTFF